MGYANRKVASQYQRQRRDKRKKIFVEQFGNKCHDCGGTFQDCCYDFHHIDPATKSFEIAPGLDRKWEVIEEEISKCIMLCSNCHRIRHYDETRKKVNFPNSTVL